MANDPKPWIDGALLPKLEAGLSYRLFGGDAYGRIKEIVEKIVASALIYLPSSAKDFSNPAIEPYLARFVRGANGIGHRERIKVMKLLWDAIGSEFGGRHELYERNYAGNHEEIRLQALVSAQRSGQMQKMQDLVDQCMADYDEHGWTSDDWVGPTEDNKRAAE
jgi:4-hydroxyphenylacetate 3-monooxygenase